MVNISVKFMGISLNTPFLIASGPATTEPGKIREYVEQIVENGWAGLVTKTMIAKQHHQLKPHLWTSRKFRFFGMQNYGPRMTLYNDNTLKYLSEDIYYAHQVNLVVIPSIIGYSLDEWGSMAKRMEDCGADALEVNLSCPVKDPTVKESMGGHALLHNETNITRVVEVVRKSCNIPVMVKLNFQVASIGKIAKVCQEAGANAVSAINTIGGVIGIDIESGELLSSDINGNGYISGISGPLIKPFGLRSVMEIAMTTDIPISGIGGIDTWQSALEYIMAGAKVVQVCSAVMWYGFSLGSKLREGLINYMKRKNYLSVDDFRGLSLKKVRTEPAQNKKTRAVIDYGKCNYCKICYIACKECGYKAIELGEDKRILINVNKCVGCGLCKVVCKREAVSYQLI